MTKSLPFEVSKTGRGAFTLRVETNGRVICDRPGYTIPRTEHETIQEAYEYHIGYATDDPSSWNICYHLEDLLN